MKKTTKIQKGIALTLAALLAGSALVFSPVSASAQSYARGDVDMDGVITGHDSAMVSRYLNVDPDLLSDEQLALADISGDGAVDQTDADMIHAREVYSIGHIVASAITSDAPTAIDAYYALMVNSHYNLGTLHVVDNGVPEQTPGKISGSWDNDFWASSDQEVDALLYNLLDVNGDTVVDGVDAYLMLRCSAVFLLKGDKDILYGDGRYDINEDTLNQISSNGNYTTYDSWVAAGNS